MKKYIQAEALKSKRTLLRKMLIIMPLFFTLFAMLLSGLMSGAENSDYFMAVVYNWFPVIFIPIIIAIFSSQIIANEQKNQVSSYHRSLNLDARKIWLSKIVVGVKNLGIIMLLNYLITILIELLWLHEEVSFTKMFICSFVIWLSFLVTIPISMVLTYRFNSVVTIISNFILSFVGVILAPESYWFLCPWSWGARMTAPLLAIAPNGLFIKAGDPLLDPNVLTVGVILAVISLSLISLVSTRYYRIQTEREA